MEKRVLISLTALQRDENGKDETMTLETPGVYREEAGRKTISYEETKISGMEGTTTTLILSDGSVRLNRDGNFLQDLEYREGERSTSLYTTPLGDLEVAVETKRIEDSISEGTGRMRLVYEVELKGLFHHHNEIIVDIREDPEHSWKSEKH